MSVKKFKFVSPGIFINEIDNSQLPRSPEEMGPIIIGRSERGPAMRPVKVESFSEFVEMFGNPISGGRGDDVWRDGNYLAPTYAAYAAQAWLRNASPLTFVRLLGVDHEDALTTAVGAGYQTASDDNHPSAWGLFVADMPDAAIAATASFAIGGAVVGDEGFTVTVDADNGAGGNTVVAGPEQSATHQALVISCTANGGGNAGEDDEQLVLTLAGAALRSYTVGDAGGRDVDFTGLSAAALATQLAAHINAVDSDILTATAGTFGGVVGEDVLIVLNSVGASGDVGAFEGVVDGTIGTVPASTNLVFRDGGGNPQGQAATDSDTLQTSASAFALDALVAAIAVADGLVSIRQAVEDAGMDPRNGLAAANATVDDNLAVQIAAVLDTGGGAIGVAAENFDAAAETGAAAADPVITLTRQNTGVAGNAVAVPNTATAVIATAGGMTVTSAEDWANGQDISGDLKNAALSAIIYQGSNGGHLQLEGEALSEGAGVLTQGSGVWVQSTGSDYEFRLRNLGAINGFAGGDGVDTPGAGALMKTISFNFDPQSKKYIRKVLNTNPTLTNSDLVEGSTAGAPSASGFPGGNLKTYWLGETFYGHLRRTLRQNSPLQSDNLSTLTQAGAAAEVLNLQLTPAGAGDTGAGMQAACLVRLDGGNAVQGNQLGSATPPRTGWVFSQHLGAAEDFILDDTSGEYPDTVKLFKLHGLYSGSWDQKNLKISIEKIKASGSALNPYGSFTVSVRRSDDSDNSVKVLEKFSNCNLDPTSPNYLARKIGDMETIWNAGEQRYQEVGQYQNKSQFLRVELNPDIDAGVLDPALVPFGFYGPPQVSDMYVEMNAAPYAIGQLPRAGTGVDGFPAGAGGVGVDDADRRTAAVAQGCDQAEQMSGVLSQAALDLLVDTGNGAGADQQIGFDLAAASVTDVGGNFVAPRAILRMPKLALRLNTRQGALASPSKAYWGVDSSSFQSATRHDSGYGDYLLPLPGQAQDGVDRLEVNPGVADIHPSFAFSLDDIGMEGCMQDALEDGDQGNANGTRIVAADTWADGVSQTHAEYLPENHDGFNGDRDQRLMRCAASARRSQCSLSGAPGADFNSTLSAGFDQFTMPLYGGSDGVDVQEKEPFSNTILAVGAAANGEVGHYAYNSVKRAIDACSDPEVVECNIMAMPGVTEPSLTSHLIKTCEDRADALAVIDLENVTGTSPGDYIPSTEGVVYGAEAARLPSVANTVRNIEDRLLNSSYGAAYFPWVQVRDDQSNRLLWVPPSVVALGTMASSQNKSELWFAPAGFTRGGLTEGAAGVPVINVRHKLSSKERDALYEVNINPIASFPSEGIVVFGQKTLQMQASALDRINVRRLLIYLKKEVSRMAATVLFDQNVQTTWSRFIGKVEPFLSGVKSRLGLTEYRVILDETTTTPDLIDRNIMYAKIMLKPARAIEFIAIDFVITNSGASFDD